jgi:hypothetical protein
VIVGPGAALGLLLRTAALTLALGTALAASAGAATATAAVQVPRGATRTAARVLATGDSWAPAWSWRSGSRGLPNGCAPYSGRTSAGMRWSPSLVRIGGGRLRLGTAGGRAGKDLAGSGIGCNGRAQLYARVKVRARMPQGAGLVARVALWPSTAGRGSEWSGLTVPSVDVGPAYVTNGCGDEAYGAEVPGRLAGAFHDYLITWSPKGFSVAADGRTLYRDGQSFDGLRWLGISLSATGPSAAKAHLVVEEVVAYRWIGPSAPPTTGATGSATGSGTGSGTGPADTGATASAPGRQDVLGATSPLKDSVPAALSGAPGTPTRARTAALTTDADSGVAAVLDATHQSGALRMGGVLVAVGVLLGVVRAARAARRRTLNPR